MKQKQLQFSFMKDDFKLYEIYSWEDQYHKTGWGGHIRFVAGTNRNHATHKVAMSFPHWWRLCGMREVSEGYWQEVHSQLHPDDFAYKHSVEAHNQFKNNQDDINDI